MNEFSNKAKEHIKKELERLESHIEVQDGPKIILHLLSNDFDYCTPYDIKNIDENKLKPIWGYSNVIPTTSFIRVRGGVHNKKCMSLTDLKNEGIIEAIDTGILKDDKTFPIILFKERINERVRQYLDILLDDLAVKTPLFFSLILIDVKGYQIPKIGHNSTIYQNTLTFQREINNENEIDDLLDHLFKKILINFH